MIGATNFAYEYQQYANYASLETFLGKYAALSSDQNFTTTLVNSGQNYQDGTDDTEASLDIQYAAALGFNTDLRFYSVGGRGPLVPDLE
jgi:tripeptidyl-peptidase I